MLSLPQCYHKKKATLEHSYNKTKLSALANYFIFLICIISLLDILAGRKDPAGLNGTVLVNGEKQPKNFKCLAGYVVQVSELN